MSTDYFFQVRQAFFSAFQPANPSISTRNKFSHRVEIVKRLAKNVLEVILGGGEAQNAISSGACPSSPYSHTLSPLTFLAYLHTWRWTAIILRSAYTQHHFFSNSEDFLHDVSITTKQNSYTLT